MTGVGGDRMGRREHFQEDTMNRLRGIQVVAALCAALATSSAWADGSPFVGRWHLNRAQSTLPTGGPVPNDLASEISRADASQITWSVTVLTTDGRTLVETFNAVGDGEFHSLSGDTTASFRLTGNTLQSTFRGPTGQSDVQTCTVSTDQKQMTCRGVLNDGNGRTVNYVDVFDRM